MCTRGFNRALLGDPSTSPLDAGFMRLRFTFGRVIGAIGLSLLFTFQAVGKVMNGRWTLAAGLAFALILSACCFMVILSQQSRSEAPIHGAEGDIAPSRRWPPLWVLLIVLWLIWQIWVFLKWR